MTLPDAGGLSFPNLGKLCPSVLPPEPVLRARQRPKLTPRAKQPQRGEPRFFCPVPNASKGCFQTLFTLVELDHVLTAMFPCSVHVHCYTSCASTQLEKDGDAMMVAADFQTCNGLLQQPVTNTGCARRVSSSIWLGFRNISKRCEKNGLVNFLVVTGHLYIENIFHSKQ